MPARARTAAKIADSSLIPGTTRLFAERTVSAVMEIHRDEHGFLKPSPHFFTFERLLERACSLIVAPPWIGKSLTARRIEEYLRATDPSRHRPLTNLEAHLASDPLKPAWWQEWAASSDRAVWIVDALDEGQRNEKAICPKLFAREGDLRELAPSRTSATITLCSSVQVRTGKGKNGGLSGRSRPTFSGGYKTACPARFSTARRK